MKTATILLALLAAVLGAALVLGQKGAEKTLTEARAETQSLSNLVMELKGKMTAQTLSAVTWQESYSNRVAELTSLSNRWTKTQTALETSRGETQRARGEIQALTQKLTTLEQRQAQLAEAQLQTNAALHSAQSELAAARKSLLAVEAQGDLLRRDLNQCRLDNDDLTRALHTIPSVEGQLVRLKAEEKAAQTRVEKALLGQPVSPKEKDAVLQLQPDGTVKVVRSSEATQPTP